MNLTPEEITILVQICNSVSVPVKEAPIVLEIIRKLEEELKKTATDITPKE